ncbi:hypothetical protein M407DRAFT_210621 [Tulasnella calospora MUT 4182]|uniref:Uncharacterized protein n=1 Tax=Tulasnella calospora MUT 4182 TaxID=1051891 RepID=A0A0C3KVH1_9AGAM|nr:hypothetical protein M407DRAFT_210621 [Tulasnella calospora MUT 4182]
MSSFAPRRISHSHASSLDSNSDQTLRRGASESPIIEARAPSDHNARPTFPDFVDRVMKGKAHLSESLTEVGTPTPAFRANNRLQEERVQPFLDFARKIRDLEDRIHEFTHAVCRLVQWTHLFRDQGKVRQEHNPLAAGGEKVYSSGPFFNTTDHFLGIEMERSDSASPPLHSHDHHSRHQKLLSEVLEALLSKAKDLSTEVPDDVDREPVIETFHSDNRIQKESIHDLDHRLDEFMRAVRSLGSSSQLILSTIELQRRMTDILDVFRSNAVSIYTAFAESANPELPDIFQSNSPHRTLKPFQDRKQFPELLADISEELGNFLKSLSDIPEFSDKKLTDSILAFEGWLIYRTGSLEDFHETGKALAHFAKDGVVAIKEAQVRSKEQLLNMSTVATFFSGVAATTFQLSARSDRTRTLGVISHLEHRIGHQLPVSYALEISDVGFLRSRSPRSALPIWEGGERWQASKSRRTGRWVGGLGDPVNVHEPWQPYSDLKRFNWMLSRLVFKSIRKLCLILLLPLGYLLGWIVSCLQRLANAAAGGRANADEESKGLPPPAVSPEKVLPQLKFDNPSNSSLETSSIKIQPRSAHLSTAPPGISQLKVETGNQVDESQESPPPSPGRTRISKIGRFNNSVLRLIRSPGQREIINSLQMSPYESKTLRTVEPVIHLMPDRGSGGVQNLMFSPDGKWFAASFANQSTEVWTVGDGFTRNASFTAETSCITWSPDSRHILAKQKEGVLIWSPNAGPKMSSSRKKFEAIAWLSDGKHFAAIHKQYVYIICSIVPFLLVPSVCTISHSFGLVRHNVDGKPFPDDQTLRALNSYPLGSVQDQPWNEEIYQRFISFKFLSAPWQAMPVRPDEVQPQRRILIYDIDNGRVAAVVPVWGEARHVSVSRNGKYALVSYAAPAPPELWQIRISEQGAVSLELYHLYLPPTVTPHAEGTASTTEFVGQAHFGVFWGSGEEDEYVVATTKKGEVYIWEAHSSQLCHVVKDARDGPITSQIMGIAWCPTNEERRVPMFGCGLGEAEIVIWKGKGQDTSVEVRGVVELESDAPRPASSDAYVDAPKDETGVQGPSRTQTMP